MNLADRYTIQHFWPIWLPADPDNLEYGLELITENDSLIKTSLFKRLFSKNELLDREYLRNIKNECYICIKKCEKQLDNYLNVVPAEWNIKNSYIDAFKSFLFNKKWIDNCLNYFLELIQHQLNHL